MPGFVDVLTVWSATCNDEFGISLTATDLPEATFSTDQHTNYVRLVLLTAFRLAGGESTLLET